MSLKSTSRTWECSEQGATDLLIMLALADHADDDGFCWPGINALAAKGRISRRQTFRVVRSLADAGELIILPRTGPRSNCYIIAIGNSRSGIERSLIRAAKMGVGEKVIEPIRTLLAQSGGDKLTPLEPTTPSGDTDVTDPTASGDADDTAEGDTDVTRSVIESSLQGDPPESAEDGASDDAWLEESRITDRQDDQEMTAEEKAEMGAPGASQDLSPGTRPGEPAWLDQWRNTLRVRYQHGFRLEHVIAWIGRFADAEHANLTPPMTKGDIADWHGGGLAFLNRCYEDLAAHQNGKGPSATLCVQRAIWCLDYFYCRRARGDDYYQHEIARPGSLSNKTVAILARDLRLLQEKFQLETVTMPKEHQMKQAFRKGGKDGKRRIRSKEDDKEHHP